MHAAAQHRFCKRFFSLGLRCSGWKLQADLPPKEINVTISMGNLSCGHVFAKTPCLQEWKVILKQHKALRSYGGSWVVLNKHRGPEEINLDWIHCIWSSNELLLKFFDWTRRQWISQFNTWFWHCSRRGSDRFPVDRSKCIPWASCWDRKWWHLDLVTRSDP